MNNSGRIPDGTYRQIKVIPNDWGENPNITVTIIKETPHIIRLVANNQWIGYAVYNESQGSYLGSWEWKQGTGGYYEAEVFDCLLSYDGSNVTMGVTSRKTGIGHTIIWAFKSV
ncbi:hypothetical protein [Baaleninema sp.]|uniref:hypothetical protein n=1 Tax=Baaleninema sp. TaxID=3101197 RepID=UPI003D0380BF